jgi:hypothetical protein
MVMLFGLFLASHFHKIVTKDESSSLTMPNARKEDVYD